jgi:protein FAM50
VVTSKLSFAPEDEELAETPQPPKKAAPVETKEEPKNTATETNDNNSSDNNSLTQNSSKRKVKISKNPFVDTSFLPDRERDEEERRMRQKLAEEWEQEQERIKSAFSIKVCFIFLPLLTFIISRQMK